MPKTSKPFSALDAKDLAQKLWSQPQFIEQRRADAILTEPRNPVGSSKRQGEAMKKYSIILQQTEMAIRHKEEVSTRYPETE